ncbi:AMP-binding protein [Escherichia coli]
MACGATTLTFEGVPNWPTPARMAQVVDKHQVNILHTAPTAIRALMAEGDKAIKAPTVRRCAFSVPWASQLTRKRGSGTGKKSATENCPVVDTWRQDRNRRFHDHPTRPGATELKAGSATRPFFGVQPALVDNEGSRRGGHRR